jgi:hypothetical protein
MLERRDWREAIQGKRLTLLVGPEYSGAGDTGRLLDARAAASAAVIAHPVMEREFPAEIARARVAADHIVQGAQLNAEARRMFAGRYLLNTLKNLRAIAEEGDVGALRDRFAGVPAVVVAAGPSLDNTLAELRKIEDRVLIVAVDTTLRPLLAAGIHPHLVVAVDPSELNARHMLDIEDTRGSWLVSEGSIDPRVFPQFAGRVFTFKVSDHEPWPWLRSHGIERGTLRAWGSVLTTAFDLAIYAGCDPIVFVGADLAFTDGVHYCRGTMNEAPATQDAADAVRAAGFAEALRQQGRTTSETVDIRGGAIVSTPSFVQFRDWLVSRALEASPRVVLNATGNGILYGDGITQADLAAMSFSGPSVNVAARLEAAWRDSRVQRDSARRAIEDVLTREGSGAIPKQAWQEFVSDERSAERIVRYIDDTWKTHPVVTIQPVSTVRPAGAAARFSAEAAGGPTPVVQWQVSADGGVSWSDVAGATTAIYESPNTAADNGKQFRATFRNRHGSATTEPAALTVTSGGVVFDFDGDGRPDVLWRDPVSGANEIWYLDGVRRTRVGRMVAVPDPAWLLPAAGDLRGAGKPDLVWRYANGDHTVWHIEGVDRVGWGTFESEPDPAWILVATADFDANGTSDIVWHNALTGSVAIWHMDGLRRTRVHVLATEVDLSWKVAAVGDFNGDCKPDLLWRNVVTGENRVWFLDGERRAGNGRLDPEPDLAWLVVGVGDFNGDGSTDLLWLHARTGEVRVWYLDGVNRIGVDSVRTDTPHTTVISAEEQERLSQTQGPV